MTNEQDVPGPVLGTGSAIISKVPPTGSSYDHGGREVDNEHNEWVTCAAW